MTTSDAIKAKQAGLIMALRVLLRLMVYGMMCVEERNRSDGLIGGEPRLAIDYLNIIRKYAPEYASYLDKDG